MGNLKEVKFVSGTTGEAIVLNKPFELATSQEPVRVAVTSITCRKSTWKSKSVEQQYGIRINNLTRDVLEVKLGLIFFGEPGDETMQNNIDKFVDLIDADLVNETPGTLYVGDEYVTGYFVDRDDDVASSMYAVEMTLTFQAFYPFWIKEAGPFMYSADSPESYSALLDYNKEYAYDYTQSVGGIATLKSPTLGASDFFLTFYGPCDNPSIRVGDNTYGINLTLGVGETAIIDSKNRKVEKPIGKTSIRIFRYRQIAQNSIFAKMQGGEQTVLWNGTFSFSIKLYARRTEPLWAMGESAG